MHTRAPVLLSIIAALASAAACGVQEFPHALPMLNPNDDFGPSTGGVGAAGMISTPLTGGTTAGAGGIAGVGVAGAAGMNVPTPDAGGITDAGMVMDSGMMNPPPSGVTLEIGGAQVAKEDAIAFIHIGHSNMAGRARSPQATRPYFFTETDPHAWMYHVGKPLEPALEPYTANDDLSGTYGGPGTALVKEAAALAPGKYFISLGFGKASAYCSQFLPGSLYYDTLMEAPLAIKDRVTFAAIVILLGITERHGTTADITGYSTCINDLVTAIRNDVGRPDLPLLLCDYEQEASGSLSASSTFARSIIPEIQKVPDVVSNSALVPTDGLSMQDDHHFDLEGYQMYVGRILQIMRDRGWFPWAP